MKKDVTPIGDIVKAVFTQIEGSKLVSRDDVEKIWGQLIGEAGSKHSRPSLLRKGVLTVEVDSSAWMQEMAMKKRPLLKGLKRIFGKDTITELQFKIGEF